MLNWNSNNNKEDTIKEAKEENGVNDNEVNNDQNNDEEKVEVLKVASGSDPNSLAGAIANVIRKQGKAELQAIGAGAINQTVKGIAISRGYVASSGIDLVCVPGFVDIEIDGEERTAIKFIVKPG